MEIQWLLERRVMMEMALMLEDKELNVFRPLTSDYIFATTEDDSERFVIHARMANSSTQEDESSIVIFITQDVLNVSGIEEGSASITILDVTGRTVWSSTQTMSEGTNRVQLPQVTAGQYIINVQTDNNSTSIRSVLN